jgi:putative tricarboxylic transport membrane protein
MTGVRSAARGVAPYAVILLVAGYLWHHALGINSDARGHSGPAFWPEAVLSLMMMTCVVSIAGHIHQSWWRGRNDRGPIGHTTQFSEERTEADPPVSVALAKSYPWMAIALTGAYVSLFPQIGYFLATSLYVTAFIYFGNYRKFWVAALLGVSASIAFMFVFMKIVYVSLPIGVGAFTNISTFMMAALGIR